mgnify:CR=1 FL=1
MLTTATHMSDGARQVLRHKKLIALFYFLNLAFALVIVTPVSVLIAGRLFHSAESERLFSDFDLSWVSETYLAYQSMPFNATGMLALAMAVLFLILNVFLAAGAIAVFQREEDTFFGACARFFGRMIRILLLALILYGIVSSINNGMTSAIDHFKNESMVARPWAILHWARLLIIWFLMGTVNMIFDYAKIICVTENRRGAIRSTLAALRFVFTNPGRTFGLYWMCTAIGLLFLLAYHGLSELIGQGSAGAVAVLFFVRQAYMATRMWTRLWTWASEVRVYDFQRSPAEAPPELKIALQGAVASDEVGLGGWGEARAGFSDDGHHLE